MAAKTPRRELPLKAEDDRLLRRKVCERVLMVVRDLREQSLRSKNAKELIELLRKIEDQERDVTEPVDEQVLNVVERMIAVAARRAFREGTDVVFDHYQKSPVWDYTGNLAHKLLKEIRGRKREPGRMRGPKATFKTDRGQFFDKAERLKWVWDGDCNRMGRKEIAELLARFYYAPVGTPADAVEAEDSPMKIRGNPTTYLEKCERIVDDDHKYIRERLAADDNGHIIRERLGSELVSFAVTFTYAGEWTNLATGETIPETSPFRILREPIPLESAQATTEELKKQFPRYVKWVSWQGSKYGEIFGCYVKQDGTLWTFESHCREPFTRERLTTGVDYASLRLLPFGTKVITAGEPLGGLRRYVRYSGGGPWEPEEPPKTGLTSDLWLAVQRKLGMEEKAPGRK